MTNTDTCCEVLTYSLLCQVDDTSTVVTEGLYSEGDGGSVEQQGSVAAEVGEVSDVEELGELMALNVDDEVKLMVKERHARMPTVRASSDRSNITDRRQCHPRRTWTTSPAFWASTAPMRSRCRASREALATRSTTSSGCSSGMIRSAGLGGEGSA